MDNWNINFNGKFYSAKFYEPQDHCIGDCSFDSETALITKKSEFPQFVLGMAYNGNMIYFIKDKHLKTFFDKHKKNKIYMANCPFDLGVVQKAQAIEDSLKEALLKNHIVDIFILDKLVKIATTGANTIPSLDRLAVEYMGVNLPKDIKDSKGNEVRLSYGNFIRRDGSVNYEAMEQTYYTYAGIDAVATWDIAQKVMSKALGLELSEHCSHIRNGEYFIFNFYKGEKLQYIARFNRKLGVEEVLYSIDGNITPSGTAYHTTKSLIWEINKDEKINGKVK